MTRAKCEPCSVETRVNAAADAATNFGWKLNVILAGVAATFLTVVGLAGWTVARVDRIEVTVRDVARSDARTVAREEVAAERRSWLASGDAMQWRKPAAP
jgi:hypothetical protein